MHWAMKSKISCQLLDIFFRINEASILLHGEMQVGAHAGLGSGRAHIAHDVAGLYLLTLTDGGILLQAAEAGHIAAAVGDAHGGAHQLVTGDGGHFARRGGFYRVALGGLNVSPRGRQSAMVSSYKSSDMLNTVTVVPSSGETTCGSSSATASTGGSSSSCGSS